MQNVLQHFFQKSSLEEVPVEALQQLTEEYPFFAPAHFWLAKKLYAQDDPAYRTHVRTAGLYFHNPLWLYLQFPAEKQPLSENINDHEPQPAANEKSPDITYEHDLIEDVVLHQEPVYEEPPLAIPDAPAPANAAPPLTGALPKEQTDAAPERTTDPREEALPLQAYHTVDYFASQGIRLNQETASDDKLGKQLKSFTEWLKTMRRLPQSPVEDILEVAAPDREVEHFAAHSLEENEVVTEAMAEVLMKQGKYEKARELYGKLSLQNPHKSAYFAAKIDSLKQH